MKTLQQLVGDTRETLGDELGKEFSEAAIVAAINHALQEAAKAGFLRRIYLYEVDSGIHVLDVAKATPSGGLPALGRINGVRSVVYFPLEGV